MKKLSVICGVFVAVVVAAAAVYRVCPDGFADASSPGAKPTACVVPVLFRSSEAERSGTGRSQPAPLHVEYRVESGAPAWAVGTPRASVTYANAGGGTSQREVLLPWSYDFTAEADQVLYISAQNVNFTSAITVKIFKNGEFLKISESEGDSAIATASGR